MGQKQGENLARLRYESAKVDLRHEMVRAIVEMLIGADVDSRCNAPHGQRGLERANHLNGYRPWLWDTRGDSIDLTIARLRNIPNGRYYQECRPDPPLVAARSVFWGRW